MSKAAYASRFLRLNAALMTGAFALPLLAGAAMAQEIETIIVTAEKRAEDIQSVPIAVSAFTTKDLEERQITQFKDLQFATPNVNYTKSNFTASNFQIRGIGTQIFATDSEFGVAFNVDDVFYSTAPVDSAQFYDIQDVEVLRGPQSTLYGRGATGGAVNVTTARPQLDTSRPMAGRAMATTTPPKPAAWSISRSSTTRWAFASPATGCAMTASPRTSIPAPAMPMAATCGACAPRSAGSPATPPPST